MRKADSQRARAEVTTRCPDENGVYGQTRRSIGDAKFAIDDIFHQPSWRWLHRGLSAERPSTYIGHQVVRIYGHVAFMVDLKRIGVQAVGKPRCGPFSVAITIIMSSNPVPLPARACTVCGT